MKVKIRNSNLEVVQGDILNMPTGAVFCPDTVNMAMAFGISSVIKSKTNSTVQEAVKKKMPITAGQIVEVQVSDMCSKYVFMAAIMGADGEVVRESVEKSMRNALDLCKELSLDSISFPMISSTKAKIPYDTYSNIMLRTIFDHLLNNDISVNVNLVIFNAEAYSKVRNSLDIIRQEYFI